jgi:hypothetical protein
MLSKIATYGESSGRLVRELWGAPSNRSAAATYVATYVAGGAAAMPPLAAALAPVARPPSSAEAAVLPGQRAGKKTSQTAGSIAPKMATRCALLVAALLVRGNDGD